MLLVCFWSFPIWDCQHLLPAGPDALDDGALCRAKGLCGTSADWDDPWWRRVVLCTREAKIFSMLCLWRLEDAHTHTMNKYIFMLYTGIEAMYLNTRTMGRILYCIILPVCSYYSMLIVFDSKLPARWGGLGGGWGLCSLWGHWRSAKACVPTSERKAPGVGIQMEESRRSLLCKSPGNLPGCLLFVLLPSKLFVFLPGNPVIAFHIRPKGLVLYN